MTLRPFNINDAPTILSWCKDKHAFRLWSADRYKDFPAKRDIGTGPCFDRQVFHKLALRSEKRHRDGSCFDSKEHEPVHVHVEGNGGMAKFVWNGSEFTLLVKEKIKANDLKKIKAVIDENADLIIKRLEEHFNS